MRNANRMLGAMMAVVITIVASGAQAQDWPQWRGANRDGKVAGFTAPQTWPKELARKWKTEVGEGDATPALVGDRLYVFARQGEDEVLQCLNAADGVKIWEGKYPVPAFKGPDAREHMGPRSSPAVAEGKVVTLGVTGIVCCWDDATNKLLWRKEEIKGFPRFHTSSSPLIADGMAIVQLGGSENGAVVAYDLAGGAPKWQWTGEGPAFASPVIVTAEGVKQVVAMTEKSVVGLDAASGKLLWQIPFAPTGRMSYNAATPIVDGPMVIVTGQGRGMKAFTLEKQGEKFVPKEQWSNPDAATQFNSPVLSKNGLIFGVSDKKKLFCINAKTGQTAWTDTVNRDAFASVVDADSVVLALSSNAESKNSVLVAFKADGGKYEELAQLPVAQTPTFACPVIAGKRIFVKDRDSLALLTLE